jgi:hypothetical protein
MNFGPIIIGDEILSGKRQDKHLPHVWPRAAWRCPGPSMPATNAA